MADIAERLLANHQMSHYQALVVLANKIMVASFILFSFSLWASYGGEMILQIHTQIAMHLLTIVSAAVFKLGYAIRCVGAFNLGHKAF